MQVDKGKGGRAKGGWTKNGWRGVEDHKGTVSNAGGWWICRMTASGWFTSLACGQKGIGIKRIHRYEHEHQHLHIYVLWYFICLTRKYSNLITWHNLFKTTNTKSQSDMRGSWNRFHRGKHKTGIGIKRGMVHTTTQPSMPHQRTRGICLTATNNIGCSHKGATSMDSDLYRIAIDSCCSY